MASRHAGGPQAEDVSSQTEPIAWWKSHEADLQNWTKALRLVLLVQPSSAAAESVVFFQFYQKTIFNCSNTIIVNFFRCRLVASYGSCR